MQTTVDPFVHICGFALLTNSVFQCFQANPKRDPNYNWQYGFLTFEEHLQLAKRMGFAIIPEIKQAYATNRVRVRIGIRS